MMAYNSQPRSTNNIIYLISAVAGIVLILIGSILLLVENGSIPDPRNLIRLEAEEEPLVFPTERAGALVTEPEVIEPVPAIVTIEPTYPPVRSSPTKTSLPTPTRMATLAPSPTATEPPRPQGKLIAFYSARTGANEIFVMNSDGTGVKQLTFDSQDSRAPTWSPDGTQIVYQSIKHGDYEIFIVDLNGNVKQVTNNGCNDYAPAWSPDGQYFAYYSDCDGNRDIYTMQIDGTHVRQLTFTDVAYNWFPLWSPDGTEITYSSNVSGNYHVMVIPASGGTPRKLQRGCISAFLPDGKKIAYTTYCMDYGNIMVMNADGSDVRTIYSKDNATNPHPSRDGKWIVFQAINGDNDDIWIMGVDGSNLTRLTTDPAKDANPVWQP
ncbi:MAG: DUF5050 domain-containing protein [Anaerolineales bacterium]|jgi:TolB protein|nr:DUF5050 domain-containing protein [Anaerolineales bacterium]